MEISKIENHVEQALDRRLEQYKNKPNIENIISIHAEGYQSLEDVLFDLKEKRINIFEAEGVQLDNIGRFVGQDRMNFDDDFYRILIFARIGINVSDGDGERVINTAKLLTKAQFVHYMNLGLAEIAVGSDGMVNPLTVDFLITNLEKVAMGSVRVAYLAIYDGDDSFSVDGKNKKTIGKGLGSINDENSGGKLAKINTVKPKFALAGNNSSNGGLGTIYDPLIGGVFL